MIRKILLSLIPLCFIPVSTDAQVLQRNNTSKGSRSTFSYSIQSTYGVTTSTEATPNLIVDAEAILNLKDGTIITNKAGTIGGDTGAVITTTPNGTDVQLSGITADNQFLIDDGTSFKSSIRTGELDGTDQKGSASASASHSLVVTVTNNNTSFINALRENFELDE